VDDALDAFSAGGGVIGKVSLGDIGSGVDSKEIRDGRQDDDGTNKEEGQNDEEGEKGPTLVHGPE
jgi:hypothetical protein